jgi:dihydroorotate dehydrogenase electron transfer subunit
MFKVAGQRAETPSTMTVRFLGGLDAVPGQFVMVWVPGVDEFPMSVSYPGARFGITYQVLGDGTKALAMRKRGDVIGIRGPYGKGFQLSGRKVLVVTGGLGIAPVAPLLEMAKKKRVAVDLVLGARTKSELLFEQRSEAARAEVYVSTDDGSKGFKGFASDLALELIEKNRYEGLYTCGPEKMIAKLVELAIKKRIPIQASLERIMKCGIGICDSCALDGMHVCRDGPVFSLQHLRRFVELGKTKLDLAGRKVPI